MLLNGIFLKSVINIFNETVWRKFVTLIPTIFLFNSIHAQSNFIEASEQVGFEHSFGEGVNEGGGGVSFYDFNNDGWDDITMATQDGHPIHFYQNNSGLLERVSLDIPFQNFESKHILWVDYDNDGDKDLFVTNYGAQDFLYNNDGNFKFTDVTEQVGLPIDPTSNFGASWVDFDKNGWLDVYITNRNDEDLTKAFNRFFKSNGDGTFTEVTDPVLADKSKLPFSSTFFDYDNDSWEDVYIAQDLAPRNSLLKNNGDGTFSDVAKTAGADVFMAGMCAAVGDYDNNGFFDVYISNTQAGGNKFLHNNGDGTFSERSEEAGLGYHGLGWGSVFLDHDNDGNLDLYASGTIPVLEEPSKTNILYHNQGSNQFAISVDQGFKYDTAVSYSNAIGDINNDGYSDIVVNNHHPFASNIWKNESAGNNYIKINLQGTISNRDGIGSRIEVYADDSKYYRFTHCGIGFLGQNSNNEIIGIGSHTSIDSIKVIWPSGHTDVLKNVIPNQLIKIIEGSQNEFAPSIYVIGDALVVCEGDQIQIGVNLYGANVSYLWNTGETTPMINVGMSGKYGVEVQVGQLTYNLEKILDLKINPKPEIDFTINDIACFGGNDGSLEANISNGMAPYRYLWPDNSTNSTISGLTSGQYTLMVTDANNCVNQKSIELTEPDEIALTYEVNQYKGTATILAEGGTPPYSYRWNDELAQTTQTAVGLSEGIYRVFVTDKNGCERFANVEVNIILNIDENVNSKLELYPNPANSFLYINTEFQLNVNSTEIQVINALGKIVDKPKFYLEGSLIKLDVRSFTNGIYNLRIISKKKQIYTSKFLINK